MIGRTKSKASQPDARLGKFRDLMVVALAVVSGATDAIGVFALGGAFASVRRATWCCSSARALKP